MAQILTRLTGPDRAVGHSARQATSGPHSARVAPNAVGADNP